MRVLLTGSDGYIGSLLGPYLSQRGLEVTGLDAGFYRSGWLYEDAAQRPRTITADLRDVEASDLPPLDAVVHLAELSNDPLGEMSHALTREINHGASLRIAELARRRGARRFVYASSCSVYGFAESWRDEDCAPQPLTEYGRCKVMVERDLAAQAGEGFSPVFLRFATAFGASPRQRFDIVLNDLAGRAWTERAVTLLSDGSPWRPFVHVFDMCEAIRQALAAPEEQVRGQVVNVGSDAANLRLADVAQQIAAVFDGVPVKTLASDADARSYRVRFDRIGRVLPGFRCAWTIGDGIRQFRRLFERIRLDGAQFKGPDFRRLPRLKALRETEQLDATLRWSAHGLYRD